MNNNNKLPSYNSITDHHHLLRGEDGREDSLVYSACTTVSDDGSVLTEEDTTSAITPDYYFEQDPFHGRHNRYYQSSDASTTTGGSSSSVPPPPPPPPLPHPSWRKQQPSNVYHRRRTNNTHNKSTTTTKCSNVLYWTYVAGFLALGSITLSMILIISSSNNNNNDNDLMNWITTTKEIGMKGRRAQNIADQSSIIVGMSNPRRSSASSYSSAGGSTNQEQDESITGDDDDIPLLGSSKNKNNNKLLLQDSLFVEEGCETTVMIIRHCERGNLKSHCNYLGYERAKYLQTLFGNEPNDLWPLPSQIYAMKTKEHSKDEHAREVETVQFVATKSELDIVAEFGSNQIKTLANTIIANITSGDMCGKLILVSWKHADIPQLANHLGCGPLQGCPVDYKGESFDPVWQIKYVYRNFMSDQQQKTSSKKNNNKSTTAATKSSSSNYWDMFGTVKSQNFDPLAFSKRYGDYPLGGTSKGGRWNTYDNDGDGDVVVSDTISSESSSSSSVVKQFYG